MRSLALLNKKELLYELIAANTEFIILLRRNDRLVEQRLARSYLRAVINEMEKRNSKLKKV